MYVIYGFALVILALTVVVLAFSTYRVHRLGSLSYQALREEIGRTRSDIARTSNSELCVRVDALEGAVAALSTSLKRQFGRVWAELHHAGVLKESKAKQSDIPAAPATDEERASVRRRLRAAHGLPTLGARPRNEHERESGRRDGE